MILSWYALFRNRKTHLIICHRRATQHSATLPAFDRYPPRGWQNRRNRSIEAGLQPTELDPSGAPESGGYLIALYDNRYVAASIGVFQHFI